MGLAYIAALLDKIDIPVKILDANALNLSAKQVVKEVLGWNADIAGISILMPGHNFAVKVARKLPLSILSVAGGPHATAVPKLLLKERFLAKKVRYRSPENMIQKIDFLVEKYKIKEMDVADDCFNFNIERAKKFCFVDFEEL